MLTAAAAVPLVAITVSTPSAFAASGGWHVVSSPGGTPSGLDDLSFLDTSDGWAAGSTGASLSGTGLDVLVDHWDGTRWQQATTPVIPQSDEALTGISAASATDAWAVGWQDPYGTIKAHALLLHWNGTSWQLAKGAEGAGIPRAVDAVAGNDVWAAGAGFIEHFDGTTWTSTTTPRAVATISAITAIGPDDVWAVGSHPGHGTGYRDAFPYSAHWDGTSWTRVRLPKGAHFEGSLTGVSASSASDVWAVGATGHIDPLTPLALHYDGTAWHSVRVTGAPQASAFADVTVLGPEDVWAVGNQDGQLPNGFAVLRTYTAHWDGTGWTRVRSRNASDDDNFLTAVASVGSSVWAAGHDGASLVEQR